MCRWSSAPARCAPKTATGRLSYLERAGIEQLQVAFGGGTAGGIFVEPTVVDGVGQDSRLFREEIFGPILSVTTFQSVDEAIALANDSVYGLAASVSSGSTYRTRRATAK